MTAATPEVDSRPEGHGGSRPDAHESSRADRRAPAPRPLAAFAYLDVALVVLALPLVLLAGAPLIGYAAGAGGWLLQRAVGVVIDRFAHRATDPKTGLIAALAGLFLRLWIVALAIILAARLGANEDGLTATVIVAAAFTVYLAMSLLIHPPGIPGRTKER